MKSTTLDIEALDSLIERIKQAQELTLALSPADLQLILNCLLSLVMMQHELTNKSVTIHKLKKLAGIINADERLRKLVKQSTISQDNSLSEDEESQATDQPENVEQQSKSKTLPKPRSPNKPHVPTNTQIHRLTEEQKKMPCPACGADKLAKYAPAEFIRITGNSPYEVVKHVVERLRCNSCGEYFTAPLTDHVLEDGPCEQKYGYGARAMMALSKYHMGSPFYRQNSLQELLHVHISASTLFDQIEQAAQAIDPVYGHLMTLAADALLVAFDDTHNVILSETGVCKPDRRTGAMKYRTGTHTSGAIATLMDGKKIVLFQTGISHAGEMIDSIVSKRNLEHPPLIALSDALSCNKVYAAQVCTAYCNAHARRNFADLITTFPEQATWVLNKYQEIWIHEGTAKTLDSQARLEVHQTHSLKAMNEIKTYCQEQLDSEQVEPNSNLGQAIQYFIRHFEPLTQFCYTPSIPLDNNSVEAILKVPIRIRKNSNFYKTKHGAKVSDIFTSIIATCRLHGVNAYEYLCCLQRNKDAVAARPGDFMPWNYSLQLQKN